MTAALIKGQQRGIFEAKHREPRHQDVGERDLAASGPRIGQRGKTVAQGGELASMSRQLRITCLVGILNRGGMIRAFGIFVT